MKSVTPQACIVQRYGDAPIIVLGPRETYTAVGPKDVVVRSELAFFNGPNYLFVRCREGEKCVVEYGGRGQTYLTDPNVTLCI